MKTAIPSSKATIVLLLDSLPGEGSERADCQITETVRHTLAAVTDRFAAFEAQALDVHVAFPLFQRLALPIPSGNTKIPGNKLQDTRMLRLMEVLLHRSTQLGGWRSRQIHGAILSAFQLTAEGYNLTQLPYDLRKLKPMPYWNETATVMPTGSPTKASASP